METKEFEQLMSEEPQRADETKIILETPGEDPAQIQTDGETEKVVTMSVGQFGATVAGIYCSVSDFVYKRIKKTDHAPAWTDAEREQVNAAITPVLEQYNITVSPLTNLIVTLAVVEAMRYTQTKPAPAPAAAEPEKGSNDVV